MIGRKALLVVILLTLAVESFRIKRVHTSLSQLCVASTATINQAPVSPYPPSSSSFDILLEALKIYKNIHHGSIHVPPNYKIPALYPYPSYLHNMSLGRKVVDIRQGKAYKTIAHRKRLDSLDFIWDVSEEKFSTLIKCIHVYRRLYPEMDGKGVPISYVIPSCAEFSSKQNTTLNAAGGSYSRDVDTLWPSHMRGYKLGASVSRMLEKIKSGSLDDNKRKILLEALGIDRHEDMRKNAGKMSEEEMIQAVENFRNLYNHLCIPSNYQIPYNSQQWSDKFWGIRLGSRITDVRRGKSGSDTLRNSLRALGLQPYDDINKSLKFEKMKPFEDIFDALKAYKALYGHLLIPSSFIIPKPVSGTPWATFHSSENIAGMRLGLRVNAIRSASVQRKLSPRVRESLNSIGFIWKVSEYKFNIFMCCMETFQSKYGHIHVPKNFTIPSTSTKIVIGSDHFNSSDDITLPWPRGSENLPLGRRLLQVKNAKLFTEVQRNRLAKKFIDIQIMKTVPREQTEVLHSLFPESTPFDRFFRALKAFQEVYGHAYVPLKFTVPLEVQNPGNETSIWPDDCLGYRLGFVCSKIRNSENGIDFLLFSRHQNKARSLGSQHSSKDKDDIESRRKIGMELLSTLSFRIMSSKDSKFQRICKGLIVHRRLFGDMDVPRYFEVPQSNDGEDGEGWPAECLGMKLGLRVRDIRRGLTYSEPTYQQILEDIGFLKE